MLGHPAARSASQPGPDRCSTPDLAAVAMASSASASSLPAPTSTPDISVRPASPPPIAAPTPSSLRRTLGDAMRALAGSPPAFFGFGHHHNQPIQLQRVASTHSHASVSSLPDGLTGAATGSARTPSMRPTSAMSFASSSGVTSPDAPAISISASRRTSGSTNDTRNTDVGVGVLLQS
ncbi:hypothetical protein HK105_209225 [Polyrhizophydium stewartii]|uniref:Uncharacterized protein n=1 Tax=Polyrhizophydium stewartii TaxID=2732419 RepID=A0ABR4MVN1_9FUNG